MPLYLIISIILLVIFVLNVIRVIYTIFKLKTFKKSYEEWLRDAINRKINRKKHSKIVKSQMSIRQIVYKAIGHSAPIIYCLKPDHLIEVFGCSPKEVFDEIDRAIWVYKRQLWFSNIKIGRISLKGFWSSVFFVITLLGSISSIVSLVLFLWQQYFFQKN